MAYISLAVGITLVLYSHILYTLIILISCLLILLILWNKIINKKKSFIQLIVKGAFLTLGLSMGYFLPYLQQTKEQISTPLLNNLSYNSLTVSDLVQQSLNNMIIPNMGIICFIFLVIGIVKVIGIVNL